MIHTPLCDLLGIQYPILQGGMAWIADASLAAAVSNAGGLGIISAMNADEEWLRTEIRKAKAMTDRPFGVNIMLKSPFAEKVAHVVAEEKIPVVTTGAGDPSRYMELWNKAGIRVLPVVASTAVARHVERSGAAAVIAEGGESGGHVGDLTTMVLVPQICDCVSIPVIAAGGIADGRGAAAAFMLGAVGVQVGTRFLSAYECTVHQNYKKRILKAKDISTVITGKRLGHPVRCLKNAFSREFLAKEYDPAVSNEELEQMGVGALRLAAREGDEKMGCFMAGQAAALVKKEQSAQEIISEIFEEAEQILREGTKWVR
ncbi:enoyl-[acyl-carrier-protein] reductase FabK [Thermocaproicibacter melissae]|uniref:enoyl-[acyl-carrier-protein] reductase FabK n=1 Tax=Thermocaproicibacter melissae TaxID=2966552 RepID=UPI0024B0E429|nr:enoyl-[acyl-carrier-protein] reductase FabK [Thermocaproicibacter melissae]WBY64667.1 enoyl-[acyl-carrier-protein] reductase FabK [Thermocaproicibacter melissae]